MCFNQIINEPTRITETSRTLIDLIFTNSKIGTYESEVIQERISDHFIICAKIHIKVQKKTNRELVYRPTDKIKIDIFSEILFHKINNQENILQNFDSFHSNFISALDETCPYVKVKTKKPFAPWINRVEIKNSIRHCKTLQSKYRKNPNEELRQSFRKEQRNIKTLISSHQKTYLKSITNQNDPKRLWRIINILMHKQEMKVCVNSSLFNTYCAENPSLLTNTTPLSTDNIKYQIHAYKEKPNAFQFYLTEPQDVYWQIKTLKSNKADHNGINTNTIKALDQVLSPFLSHYINFSIINSCYPDTLKYSRIIPVAKTNNQSCNPKDYRPIAIQATFSKIFEKCLLKQMNEHLDKHNILSEKQFGFRKGKSTESLLHLMYDRICSNIDSGQLTVIISLDLSKAFDTLDHSKLIEKLHQVGFSKQSMLLILSYLRERFISTLSNNDQSSSLKILSGVPQGSILGPVLFNIYINDFISTFLNADVFQYADDCQILLTFNKTDTFASILHVIEETINKADFWCSFNSLCLNKKKTNILPIFTKNSVFSVMPFFNQSSKVSSSLTSSPSHLPSTSYFTTFSSQSKILGVLFNTKLSWSDHFLQQNISIQKTFYSLKSLFNRYTAKRDVFLRLMITSRILIPKISYSISLFHTYNEYCNKMWLAWNRRIGSLCLQKFVRSSELKQLPLFNLSQWTRFKLITFVHSFLSASQSSQFLQFHIKQSKFNMRATHFVCTKKSRRSTEQIAAQAWNNLPTDVQKKILEMKKLTLKDLCVLCDFK